MSDLAREVAAAFAADGREIARLRQALFEAEVRAEQAEAVCFCGHAEAWHVGGDCLACDPADGDAGPHEYEAVPT